MSSVVSGSNIKVEDIPDGFSEAEQLALLSYEAFQPGCDLRWTHETDSSARKTLLVLREVIFVQQREFNERGQQAAEQPRGDRGALPLSRRRS